MDADTAWLLAWLAIALGAGIAEVLSLDLLFATVAGAALVTAGAAGAGASPGLQLVVFAASAVVLLVGVRPPLKRRLERSAPASLTGVAALVGRTAFVLSDVTERGGRVKLAGEVWSARADQPGAVLPAESEVVVVAIDGAVAVCAATPATPGAAGTSAPAISS